MKGINTILTIPYKVIGIKKITISYPDEQYEWLEQHPEINKSGLFRAMVGYLMKTDKASLNGKDLEGLKDQIIGE